MSRAPEPARGTVLAVFRGGCEAVCGDTVYELHLTGLHARDEVALAVGDDVRFDPASGRLIAVEPRRTSLERLRPRERGRGGHRRAQATQTLAANMDQVAIVVAAVEPRFTPGLVDRFLLAARAGGLDAVLVCNKLDLVESGEVPEDVASYASVVPVVGISAHTGRGLDPLRGRLAGARTVLAGHSGVGKSSVLNALDPELRIETGELRERDRKGRHTTSRASWYRLAADTIVVDTPGIREIATRPLDPALLADVYPEIEQRAEGCRFRDCAHDREPDCAVRAAVEAGELSPQRLASYQKLRRELTAR